jgi:hypothetical protein
MSGRLPGTNHEMHIMSAGSPSGQLHRLKECHNHILGLYEILRRLSSLLDQVDPDWESVQTTCQRYGAVREWLFANNDAVRLFDGLHPSGVDWNEQTYQSWHDAMVRQFVLDREERLVMLLWLGLPKSVFKEGLLSFPDHANWLEQSLGFQTPKPDDVRRDAWHWMRVLAGTARDTNPGLLDIPPEAWWCVDGWRAIRNRDIVFGQMAERLMAEYARVASPSQQSTAERPTIWYHGGKAYSNGRTARQKVVSSTEHYLLQEFLAAGHALGTAEIKNVGNVSETILKLIDKFGEPPAGPISRPENKGDGYFINVRDARG